MNAAETIELFINKLFLQIGYVLLYNVLLSPLSFIDVANEFFSLQQCGVVAGGQGAMAPP